MLGFLGRGGVLEVEDEAGKRYALRWLGATGLPEATALLKLAHENLVTTLDVFVERGHLCLVMEKIVGRTLGEARRFEPRQALVVVRQILDGVGHAHSLGIIHGDLKPDNVMLVDMGGWERVKILDVGLARLQTVTGTARYMAPEQGFGRTADTRADLYAVGIMLYELFSGAPPFDAPDPYAVMQLHATMPVPSLMGVANGAKWCTPELLALVGIALAKDPAHRFATALVMRAALDRAFTSLDRT